MCCVVWLSPTALLVCSISIIFQLPAQLDKFAFVVLDQFQALFFGLSVKELGNLINMLKSVFLDKENPYFFILSGGEQTSVVAALNMADHGNRSLLEYDACISTRTPTAQWLDEWTAYCAKAKEIFHIIGVDEQLLERARKWICLIRGFPCIANVDHLLLDIRSDIAFLCKSIIDSYRRDIQQTPIHKPLQQKLSNIADGESRNITSGLEAVVVRVPCYSENEGQCFFYRDVLFNHYLSQMMLSAPPDAVVWKHAG